MKSSINLKGEKKIGERKANWMLLVLYLFSQILNHIVYDRIVGMQERLCDIS